MKGTAGQVEGITQKFGDLWLEGKTLEKFATKSRLFEARKTNSERKPKEHVDHRGAGAPAMYAAFKYVVGVSAAISIMALGAIFLGSAATVDTSPTLTPSWKIERLRVDPDLPHVAQGSLSPLYPATPGKELLGKPIAMRAPARHAPVSEKPITKTASATRALRQARVIPKLPPQLYMADDRTYFRRGLSYADDQPRRTLMLSHDLY